MKFNQKEIDDRGMNIWIQAYENLVDQSSNDVNGNDFEGCRYNDINEEEEMNNVLVIVVSFSGFHYFLSFHWVVSTFFSFLLC